MITHLLDTNIVSYAIRPQNGRLAARLADAMRDESVAISAVTRAEMRTGQMRMATNDKRLVSIDQMLQLLPALDWTSICADLYGRIHSFLATTGQPISICDVQIAAHALAENLTLVTHTTRRFERIERLRLEDWTGLESL